MAERTAAGVQERTRQCVDDAGVLEAELRRRVAEIDARSADSLAAFESSLVALRERAEAQTDEHAAVAAGLVERWTAEVQERSRQCVDDAGVLEAELRRRVAEVEAEVDESRIVFVSSLVALHERAEAQTDEHAAVAAGQVERWTAEVQERSRQCVDDAGVLEAELRRRVAEVEAEVDESRIAFVSSLVTLHERAEPQTDEEVARWSTAANGRIDDALRSIDEQADAVAGQVASRGAEILAVAERTVAEAQERARRRLDETAAFENELRTSLGEQADAMAARVASRVEQILSAAERAVTEARSARSPREVWSTRATRSSSRRSKSPKDVTSDLPAPTEVPVCANAPANRDSTAIPVVGRRLLQSNGRRAPDGGEPERALGTTDDIFGGTAAVGSRRRRAPAIRRRWARRPGPKHRRKRRRSRFVDGP